ncbi:MAG: hypothetical protein NVS3B5_07670 [Sphingomicrobium sp.]
MAGVRLYGMAAPYKQERQHERYFDENGYQDSWGGIAHLKLQVPECREHETGNYNSFYQRGSGR